MVSLNKNSTTIRRTALATAVALAVGGAPAFADIYTFSFSAGGNGAKTGTAGSGDALFTMLDPGGTGLQNTSKPYYYDATWGYGMRTQISGTLTFDTTDNSGTVSITPFQFFNGDSSLPATATGISYKSAGTDSNNGHPLVLANMLFDWNGNSGIPVALVWDVDGLVTAVNDGLTIGDTVSGGTTIASDGIVKGKFPVGAAPVASTTWDATDTCTVGANPQNPPPGGCMTVNPIGSTPLIANSIGGDPMVDGPFTGFNANFDFFKLTLTNFADTTAPVITLGGSSPTNLSVGDTYTETATCTDAVDGNLTGSMTITGGPVDTSAPGTFNLTYNCSDNSTNAATQKTRTVNVSSAGTPAITLLGNNPQTHEAGAAYTDAGASCTDPSDGSIPLPTDNPPQFFNVSSNTVNANVPGAYSVTYTCTSSSGTSAPNVSRDVNVVDTTPPAITLTPTCPITQIADGSDPTPTATATDLVDGSVTVTRSGTVNPMPAFGNALSRTFNLGFAATDTTGNTSNSACDVTLGNPLPVATLAGNATVVIGGTQGFTDPGATCTDFVDGALPDATADTVIDNTTPNGSYTITYTCGPNSGGKTGSISRSVVKGVAFSATSTSGSTFSMLDPDGKNVGGADDIFFSWTGDLYTTNDPATQGANMFMGSSAPQPFFGFPWVAHDIRAFAPGDYSIATTRGNTLHLQVGENQIGAHMLFDWNGNNDIDVVLTWDINGVFDGSLGNNDDQGSKGKVFGLASIDSDNDGLPGTPMADGPFAGFNANFNIKLTPQFALPDATVTTAQGTNDPTSIIVSTADTVTLTTTVNADVNGAYSYGGPFTYDWSSTDAAVLAGNSNGISSSTFLFNPSGLPDGKITVVSKVTDGATGLSSTVRIPLRVVSGVGLTSPSVQDSDGDGIPDAQDGVATPTTLQAQSGNNAAFLVTSSSGKLTLGDLASNVGAQTGVYQARIAATDIPAIDNSVDGSCVGGCFSFKVSGLTPGAAVDVVLPLSEAIPAGAGVRKFLNNTWRDFDTSGGNGIMSAPGGPVGVCPAPTGSWTAGLTTGDTCVKLTIVDGGANDGDGVANGTVVDPSGVSGASTTTITTPPGVGSASTGGCVLNSDPVSVSGRADWWLVGGLLAWLGLQRRRSNKKFS